MKTIARTFCMAALVITAGISQAQIATGWTIPGQHSPIVRGGDGVIRMDWLTAVSPRGVVLWSTGLGNYARDIKAASDGLTYACTRSDVFCLNSSGGQVWKYRVPIFQEEFYSMRVAGDYLWVVGTYPIKVGQVTRYGVGYKKFDRRTGAKLHSSEFFLSTDPAINEGAVKIVGNSSANFLVVGATGAGNSKYLGLARMDLDTGALVSSTFFLSGSEPTGAAVDSQNQVYVVDGTLRKFDGSSTPAITLLWARSNATGTTFISKGSIYTKNERAIVKTLPNGDQTTLASFAWPETVELIAADPAGVIYTMMWAHNYVYPNPLVAYTHVIAFDPATGQRLWTEVLNPDAAGTASLTTDAWGTVFASGGGKTVALYRTPDPQPDTYTLPGGRTFTVNAPGLMANDGYTDPFVCTAYKYTNPANGYLTVRIDGSFDYTPKAGFIGQDSFQYEVVRGVFARYTTVNLTVYHAANPNLGEEPDCRSERDARDRQPFQHHRHRCRDCGKRQ